jgi:[protein-PII] uridylyltransferase
LASTIADNSTSYKKIRAALAAAGEDLKARFEAGESVVELVHARAAVIDEQLRNLWSHDVEASGAALIAVGGYGRGELHPYSDVDVMVLLPDDLPPGAEEALSAFITSLWDVGLEIGHSVRTIAQCFEEASSDLTVATTLMEARLLAGPKTLFEAMQAIIAPDKMWPSTALP